MNKQGNYNDEESLSALMDDEAGEFELRRIIAEMSSDEAKRETWHRYHLVRGVLRKERIHDGADHAFDLTEAISRAVNDEQAHSLSNKDRARPLFRTFGRVAVAASVAIVAVVGVKQYQSASVLNGAPLVAQVESGYEAPQFHLPSGFDLQPLTARTVSANTLVAYPQMSKASVNTTQRSLSPEMERQVQHYIHHLMTQYDE